VPERNGATVARVAQKLAKGPNLYLTTTHYHSEHTSGEQAFPANTIIIRAAVQEEETLSVGTKFDRVDPRKVIDYLHEFVEGRK
jgi:hypothetical protein